VHEGEEMCNIFGFLLHSISKNENFDPMIMMVQKLIRKLINFLGPREEIGSPSQEHSFYYLGPILWHHKVCHVG
jgi:hypothetical protein